MERSPATLRQMLGRSLEAFQHLAAPVPRAASLDMDWAVFCRHLSGAVQIRPDRNLVDMAIALEQAVQQRTEAAPANPSSADAETTPGKDRETAALLYLLAAALEPDPRAFNNLAVISAEADDMQNALHWLRLGLSLFPEDPTLAENLHILEE